MGETMTDAFPYAIRTETVKQLRQALTGLPDEMPVQGFYDDAMGSGIVWVQVDDNEDGRYFAVDVERNRSS